MTMKRIAMRGGAFASALALSASLAAAAAGSQTQLDVDKLHERANETFEPIPSRVPEVDGNAVTHSRVELGRMLFFDPRLSASQALSCNSCHQMGLGGDDNQTTSIGHGWQQGPRNAPTVFNAVFNTAQFWDGRAEDLKAQAKGPVQASVEMANTPKRVEKTLRSIPGYIDAFEKAFPRQDQPVTFDNMAKALEAFQATLITPASRFDQFLEGNYDALDATEKRGLKAFMDVGCSACHAGVNLGGQNYYPFGVVKKPGSEVLPRDDKGRFQVTKTASDNYVFRAAPLRNIELTAPYFHSGQVWDLEQAVAIMGVAQLGQELSEKQITQITAFLRTLTGEQPRVQYPVLPKGTDETPRPVPFEEAPERR
jgi:cytochrome c peroxidase